MVLQLVSVPNTLRYVYELKMWCAAVCWCCCWVVFKCSGIKIHCLYYLTVQHLILSFSEVGSNDVLATLTNEVYS